MPMSVSFSKWEERRNYSGRNQGEVEVRTRLDAAAEWQAGCDLAMAGGVGL